MAVPAVDAAQCEMISRVFWEISRKQCLIGFERFFLQNEAHDRIREKIYSKVIGHLLVAIIVQGAGFRLTLKAHPDLTPLKNSCAKICGIPVSDVDEHQIRDCVREYLNIVGGGIQAELSRMDLESRLSLPVATRGFDELFFGKPSTPIQHETAWDLIWPDGSIPISALLELIDPQEVTALLNYKPGDPGEDLFELLTRDQQGNV